MLKFCDCVKTGGGQPRFISLDENSENVVVANETTDTITFFAIDSDTGSFSALNKTVQTESPVCVIFN